MLVPLLWNSPSLVTVAFTVAPGFSRLLSTYVFQSWPVLTTCLIVFVSAGGSAVGAYVARRWRGYQDLRLNQVRRRIATDLHDDIGSSLSQVAIMCEVLSRRSVNERESLQEIAGVSRNALTSMSEIVWAVDPTHDHLHDLTQRMRWFAGDTLSGRNVSLEFTALEPSWEVRLAADTRRQLFLIFKESVNNIVRHSGATHARVLLRVLDDALLLTVEDDGRGFDASTITEGNGLRNIGCRATLLQGKVEIRSRVGQGTLIVLRVPLMQAAQPWHRMLVRSRRVAAA